MQAETRVAKLERKVNVLSKALDLLLFEEAEDLSEEEARVLKERLSDFLCGKKDEFVPR